MENKSDLKVTFLTFIGSLVAFVIYVNKYLSVNSKVYKQIKELVLELGIGENKTESFILVLIIAMFFIYTLIGYIMYKTIVTILKLHLNDIMLFNSILSTYIVVFISGYFLLNFELGVLYVLITNIIEIVVILVMLYDAIKPKVFPVIFVRSIFTVLNLIMYMLQ